MSTPGPLPTLDRVRLGARIVSTFALVHWRLRRSPLPRTVQLLGSPQAILPGRRVEPRRLGRIVYRTLHVAGRRPRCLINALVLFRLLHAQGDAAELVIGLPHDPKDPDAHAWVEVDHEDVGPPPGRNGHEELARYR
jgi:hypothetical protein